MEKFISANNHGKGFITHEDKETNGLKFEYLGSDIVKVVGNEDRITAWMNRVSGSEMIEALALTIIDAEERVNKLKRIQELKTELVTLEEHVQ